MLSLVERLCASIDVLLALGKTVLELRELLAAFLLLVSASAFILKIWSLASISASFLSVSACFSASWTTRSASARERAERS